MMALAVSSSGAGTGAGRNGCGMPHSMLSGAYIGVLPYRTERDGMALSVFDLYSIGIGPSSSHTVGPMRAAKTFVDGLRERGELDAVARIHSQLYGSLGATGHGHGSDKAVILGLEGQTPEDVDTDRADERVRRRAHAAGQDDDRPHGGVVEQLGHRHRVRDDGEVGDLAHRAGQLVGRRAGGDADRRARLDEAGRLLGDGRRE